MMHQGDKSVGRISRLRWALLVLVVALSVRLMILLSIPTSLDSDPDSYRRMAQAIKLTGTFGLVDSQGVATPTAYRPPLYPWLLSWFSGLDSDRLPLAIVHAILGGLTVALTFDIARRLGFTLKLSLIASLLVLLDPILIRQSTLVMTETLATFIGMALWWVTLVTGWTQQVAVNRIAMIGIALGVVLGFACLCRPTSLAWCLLWGCWEVRRNPIRAVSLILGCLLVLVPWARRNQEQLGQAVWTTTHGGYTLLLANNPILYEHWSTSWSREWQEELFHDWWRKQQDDRFAGGFPGEIELDRFASSLGIETIQSSPGEFIKACLIREGWFWAWWPSQRQADFPTRLALGFWYGLIFIAALIGLLRLLACRSRDIESWIPVLFLALSLCIVHAVYWSNMRMRAPIIPLTSLLAISAFKLPSSRSLLGCANAVETGASADDQVVADDGR